MQTERQYRGSLQQVVRRCAESGETFWLEALGNPGEMQECKARKAGSGASIWMRRDHYLSWEYVMEMEKPVRLSDAMKWFKTPNDGTLRQAGTAHE